MIPGRAQARPPEPLPGPDRFKSGGFQGSGDLHGFDPEYLGFCKALLGAYRAG